MELGRAVYNFRCYFCHGYNGDAETVAAGMLDPKPRNFLRATGLDRARILHALRNGRPGTAMASFADVLPPEEIEAVAEFVERQFVACGARNTHYHTEANGWPDHEARYAPAFPFATGEMPLDFPDYMMTAAQRAGAQTFRSACISCHEPALLNPPELAIFPAGAKAGEEIVVAAAEEHEEHSYDTPTIHDRAPEIDDLTEQQAAGAALYTDACAECHAADGSGRNWIGRFLRPNPPDFTTPDFAAGFGEESFAARTLEPTPQTSMPSFLGVLSEADAAAIAAYVRRAFVAKPGD